MTWPSKLRDKKIYNEKKLWESVSICLLNDCLMLDLIYNHNKHLKTFTKHINFEQNKKLDLLTAWNRLVEWPIYIYNSMRLCTRKTHEIKSWLCRKWSCSLRLASWMSSNTVRSYVPLFPWARNFTLGTGWFQEHIHYCFYKLTSSYAVWLKQIQVLTEPSRHSKIYETRSAVYSYYCFTSTYIGRTNSV